MNTLLIGPRGSGKTSLGRRLAAASGLRFVDLDDLVLARFPEETVGAVWETHGEAAWRTAEAEILETALRADAQVIALGGGTPVIPQARAMIEAVRSDGRARAVYLQCTVEELERRLAAGAGDRPSLTGDDPVAEIGPVLRRREPEYLAVADVVIPVRAGEPVETTLEHVRVAIAAGDAGAADEGRS